MIFHITTPTLWQTAIANGYFETGSLHTEGFIHCCTKEQINGVVQRYYKNLPGLVLLSIDETRLTASLKYELSPLIDQLFPHVYGSINLDAIQNTAPLPEEC